MATDSGVSEDVRMEPSTRDEERKQSDSDFDGVSDLSEELYNDYEEDAAHPPPTSPHAKRNGGFKKFTSNFNLRISAHKFL